MSWEQWRARLVEHAAAVLDAPGLRLEEFGSEAEYRRCFEDRLTPERAFQECRPDRAAS